MNPFECKPKKVEQFFSSREMSAKAYDKNEVDPYTRLRVILTNGAEFESVRFSHAFSRCCANNDVRRSLALMRRGEQLQQKRITDLKPGNESVLEHTIGYEQLAVDLTAILAGAESNSYVKKQLDFALLEDFDHLYRYSDLMELEKRGDPARLVGDYTEIMPGRPTVAEFRHPFDDVRFYINGALNDLKTKLAVNIITAAEQQTMNFYMNVANTHPTPLGRRLFREISLIEEQHVTGYGCLKDPCATIWENLVMNEYTECYLYYSCYEDEKDEKIRSVWEMHFEEEVAHLHEAVRLMQTYEGRTWQQIFPSGGEFPELLRFTSQKDYIREVLKSVRLTGVEEGFEELDRLPDSFRFFSYNKKAVGNAERAPSHEVIVKTIAAKGEDWRLTDAPHPIAALDERTKDNTVTGRVKGK